MNGESLSTGACEKRPGRLRAALAHPYLPAACALLAMLLLLPALGVGFVVDDHYHRAIMRGSQLFGEFVDSPMDMFNFFDGDPQRVQRMIDLGIVPWWTLPEIKASFWRPLSVLTHWLDYRLWPNCAVLMHVHSILWFGALVLAVSLLYRRLMAAAWLAGLAGLLYAIDDAHGMPVSFLANRNVLLATFFGVLALWAHDRWRRDGWRVGAVLGPALLLVSLLAKEAGLATCGYLAAHALFLDRGTWRRRIVALAPYAVVVIAWRATWSLLGYGFQHAGVYVDPLIEPMRFAAAVLEHAPLLLLGQWALPPAEVYLLLGPEKIAGVWWAGVAFLVLLGVMLAPLLRRDQVARFWAVGMLLSLLPICATFPADRMLFFVGIGAMGLLAQFLAGVFGAADWRPQRGAWRIPAALLGGLFVLMHLVVAPIALPFRAAFPTGPPLVEQFYVRVELDESVANQDVIVLNPPSSLHAAYFLIEREAEGLPVPRRARMLCTGFQSMTLHRPDARTLIIRPADGFFAWIFERLFRDEKHALPVGGTIELTGLTIEVLSLTGDGRPAEVAFHFDVPLEDPSLRWLRYKDCRFGPFIPPAVDETVEFSPGERPW